MLYIDRCGRKRADRVGSELRCVGAVVGDPRDSQRAYSPINSCTPPIPPPHAASVRRSCGRAGLAALLGLAGGVVVRGLEVLCEVDGVLVARAALRAAVHR